MGVCAVGPGPESHRGMGLKLPGMGWRSGGIHVELGRIVWLQHVAVLCLRAAGWFCCFLPLMSLLFNLV